MEPNYTPAEDGISLPTNNLETVKVVQAEGMIEDRVVPPSRGGRHEFEIPEKGKLCTIMTMWKKGGMDPAQQSIKV
jgi:hypothetical protein